VLGESGCGKTTLVRCLAGLLPQDAGTVVFAGEPLPPAVAQRSVGQRRRIAYVPQNPYDSLNPRHTVAGIVGRPLRQFGLVSPEQIHGRCGELLDLIGLGRDLLGRHPSGLSGGQRQRVALARALAGSPDLLLCDEVTSALDSAAGKAIVDLLARMRDRLGLGLIVVTHDPWVAARLGGEVLVLHDGRTVEAGPAAEVLTRPAQPYPAALLAAAAR